MTTPATAKRRAGDPPEPAGPGRVYGYLRVSTDKQALSPEVQRDHIKAAAARNNLTVDAWFQDAPVQNEDGTWNDACSGKVAIGTRKAGRELCDRLRRGDVVIVAKMDRAFRLLSDCVVMLDRWERLGVSLIVCDFPMLSHLNDPFQKTMLQLFAVFGELERKLISARTREALALRKRKGHRHNRFCGYGFTHERRFDHDQKKYVKVVVRCDAERQVMGQIVRWKMDGYGWDHITLHLERQGVLTKHGTVWSRARVIRAFRAELVLQANENQNRNDGL